jgi:hypothetical protein
MINVKKHRKNITLNHLHALRVVALLVNATPQSVAFSCGQVTKSRVDYWRSYLNDLVLGDFLVSKKIYISDVNADGVRTGRSFGSLFALTQKGAEFLAEGTEETVYYPKGGITSESPIMYPHRSKLLDVLGLIIGLEKTLPAFQVFEVYPYFRHTNSTKENRTGFAVSRVTVPQDNGKPYKTPVLIPDAVVKIRVGDRVRLLVIELHRQTSVNGIIEALRKHAQAIENRLFNEKFEVPGVNFVLAIHTDQDKLKNTVKTIRNGEFPNFERYEEGFIFGTVGDMVEKGVYDALYHLNEQKSPLFTNTFL